MAIIHCDGGSRGNPGPAAAGYWITHYGKIVDWNGVYLGERTNNYAELEAVCLALTKATEYDFKEVEVRSDSRLVIGWLRDGWKTNDAYFNDKVAEGKCFNAIFKKLMFIHIPREQNAVADFIVNITLNQNERAV